MSDTSLTAFFGDSDYTFRLGPTEILELERRADAGIGAVFQRVSAGLFHYADLVEIIRLGLVGAGTHPQRAKQLVDTYADGRPIREFWPIATAILMRAWSGPEKPEPAVTVDLDAAMTGDFAAALNAASAEIEAAR